MCDKGESEGDGSSPQVKSQKIIVLDRKNCDNCCLYYLLWRPLILSRMASLRSVPFIPWVILTYCMPYPIVEVIIELFGTEFRTRRHLF